MITLSSAGYSGERTVGFASIILQLELRNGRISKALMNIPATRWAGLRIRSDIDRIRIQPLRTNRILIQTPLS